VLDRLKAKIRCLQEVNGQKVGGRRTLAALDALLAGSPYAGLHRASTRAGAGVADVHNLVTLSRFPIIEERQVLHDLLPPLRAVPQTAEATAQAPAEIQDHRHRRLLPCGCGGARRLIDSLAKAAGPPASVALPLVPAHCSAERRFPCRGGANVRRIAVLDLV
jgi:hypothetical protein